MLFKKIKRYWMRIWKVGRKNFTGKYYICKERIRAMGVLALVIISLFICSGCSVNSDNKEDIIYPFGHPVMHTPSERALHDKVYEERSDGTLKLFIEAVWERKELDQAISSELVVRPLENGRFQYVSNRVTGFEGEEQAGWYMPRLSDEEWKEYYGGTE